MSEQTQAEIERQDRMEVRQQYIENLETSNGVIDVDIGDVLRIDGDLVKVVSLGPHAKGRKWYLEKVYS